jgi:NADH:ubiquinone oxidoreductase subunit 2 (subunit N)
MFFLSTLAFTQKRAALRTWNLVSLSSLLGGITTWLSDDHSSFYVELFASGILPAWILGLLCIKGMRAKSGPVIRKFTYQGMAEKSPKLAIGFFLAFLGMVGFPISPAFLGQDLILYHLSGEHAWLAPLVAISLVLNGISVSGIFMRLCAGRPIESRQEFESLAPRAPSLKTLNRSD